MEKRNSEPVKLKVQRANIKDLALLMPFTPMDVSWNSNQKRIEKFRKHQRISS